MGPVVGTIGLILGAVGTGLSYSAQMSAASTQETFSLLNAQAGVQQATQQANMAALQSQLQSAQADTARRAAEDNAAAMRSRVESDSAQAQENLRRDREEFARKLAAARAQSAGSGVDVTSGSPLDMLLAASEEQAQLEAEQQWQIGNLRSRGFRQAAAVALGGRVEGLNSSLYLLEGEAAQAEGRMRATQARLGGMAGQAQASGQRAAAFGSLFDSLGASAGQAYDLWQYRRASRSL
jgi:hypothetical protein